MGQSIRAFRKAQGIAGTCYRVTPVHWQAGHNDAMIVAQGQTLQLTEEESRAWFAVLADFTGSYGMQLHYLDKTTWLLVAHQKPPLFAQSVENLVHKPLVKALRQLDPTLFWQRFLTEVQMLFSTHALNQECQAIYTINGVWIWRESNWFARWWKRIWHAR